MLKLEPAANAKNVDQMHSNTIVIEEIFQPDVHLRANSYLAMLTVTMIVTVVMMVVVIVVVVPGGDGNDSG